MEFQDIFNLPTHLFVVINADGILQKVNYAQKEILGWDPDELIGKELMSFIVKEDQLPTWQKIRELLEAQTPLTKEFRGRYLHKNGGHCWISWSGSVHNHLIYAIGTDITDRVKEEEALLTHSLLLESMTEGVVICDQRGRITYCNPAQEKMYGYDQGELIGKQISIFDDLVQEKRERLLSEVLREIQQNNIWKGEMDNVRKDGVQIHTSCTVTTLRLAGVTHYICVQRDRTKERKIKHQKEELERRLALAVKAGKIGIWEWTLGEDKIAWDETTEEIYGYGIGTFPGTREAHQERIHPDDRESLEQIVNQALINKKSYLLDHRIIRVDGRTRWVQRSGMAFYNDEGRPYHMSGTVMDITERKEAEEDQKFLARASEILSSSFEYQSTLNNLGQVASSYFCDGVLIDMINDDGSAKRIVAIHPDPDKEAKLYQLGSSNKKFEKDHPFITTLLSGKTALRPNIQACVPVLEENYGEDYARSVQETGIQSTIMVRLRGREKLLGVITFFSVKTSSHVFDKRHLWLAEELAYRLSMALENSLLYLNSQEAIKARDEFLSIASHELKTPLTSLTLQNQMRKRQLDRGTLSLEKDYIHRMMEADDRQLKRINRLIDDMLDITRIRAKKLMFHKERVEFCAFVRDVVERYRPQIESNGCTLTATYCPEVIGHYDIYRIEQVLVNILTNAMKYGAGRPIFLEVHSFRRTLRVLVKDEGPGIKQEDLERIFQRFERAISSNEVSGLGLGLYISRQIMEEHDGSLSVASTVGQGSTFIMELPLEK